MSDESPEDRLNEALRRTAEALEEWSELGADERRQAFMRAHLLLPDAPVRIRQAGEGAYLQWAIGQCLAMYDEGTHVARAAAAQAFGVFLRRYPSTQRYMLDRPSPFISVIRQARQGREAFERAMYEYVALG